MHDHVPSGRPVGRPSGLILTELILEVQVTVGDLVPKHWDFRGTVAGGAGVSGAALVDGAVVGGWRAVASVGTPEGRLPV